MAFPFKFDSRLRRQLLVAIGSTGVLSAAAMGCAKQSPHGSVGAGGRGGQNVPAAGSSGSDSAGRGASGASGAAGSEESSVSCESGSAQRDCLTLAEMEQKAKFGCGMIAISPVPTMEEVRAKFLANGCLQQGSACDGCCNPPAAEGEPQGDGSCCYTFCSGACCGRPFVVGGSAQLAGVEPRHDWIAEIPPLREPAALSARIAAAWLEDARMEHASIASFARFTLDLLMYGAPAELVELAQRAGMDEVEHARLCFGLAAHYGAEPSGPAPLRAAAEARVAPSLWDAALAAFQEGCVGETLAALQARAAYERAKDPEVRRSLRRIARDESRHAELAWRFVAWAASRLGTDFGAELRRTLSALLAVPAPSNDEAEDERTRRTLHAAGRLTHTDKQRLDHAGLHEVIAPCVAALIVQHSVAEAEA